MFSVNVAKQFKLKTFKLRTIVTHGYRPHKSLLNQMNAALKYRCNFTQFCVRQFLSLFHICFETAAQHITEIY